MQGICSFLEKFKNFTPPALILNRAVRTAVSECLGMQLSERSIVVSRGVARIEVGGAQKSEILLHKEELLRAAREKSGSALKDIR